MKKRTDFAAPLRIIVGITFFIIIAVTCIQVICRYVFNHSLVWSEELARFLVIWLCMVGSAVANFDDDHMTINVIIEKFSPTVQFSLYTVRQAMIIIFCVVCSYSSFPLLKAAGTVPHGAMELPTYLWRLPGTLGLAAMAVMTILRWYYDFGRYKAGEFCLKDADTEIAESNEGKAVLSDVER